MNTGGGGARAERGRTEYWRVERNTVEGGEMLSADNVMPRSVVAVATRKTTKDNNTNDDNGINNNNNSNNTNNNKQLYWK